MIKLALPAYDPQQPLGFMVTAQIQVSASAAWGFRPGTLYQNALQVELWAGQFVGWVDLSFGRIQEYAEGVVTLRLDGRFESPAAVGLTGAEGWFKLVPMLQRPIFVTDCVVSYTPAGQQGAGGQTGYFT